MILCNDELAKHPMLHINVYDPNVGICSWFHIRRGDYGITVWLYEVSKPNLFEDVFCQDEKKQLEPNHCNARNSKAKPGSVRVFQQQFPSVSLQFFHFGLHPSTIQLVTARASAPSKMAEGEGVLRCGSPKSIPQVIFYCIHKAILKGNIPLPTVFFRSQPGSFW